MTNTTPKTLISGRSARLLAAAVLILLAALMAAASSARADLEFDEVRMSLDRPPAIDDKGTADPSDDYPFVNPDGTYADREFERQAGSHPDFSIFFKTHTGPDGVPVESAKDIDVALPKGMFGNPTALPTCSPEELINSGGNGGARCSLGSQVGVAEIVGWATGGRQTFKVGLFNVSHDPDIPAQLGFNFNGVIGLITARVTPGDYRIASGSFSISQAYALESVRVTLWGVPADRSHDWERQDKTAGVFGGFNGPQPQEFRRSSPVARLPFLTLPPSCPSGPLAFTMRGDSWEHPDVFDSVTLTADEDGTPLAMEGCGLVPFKPAASAQALARAADVPTGLDVDIEVPQPQDPDGIASAHVRKVKMTLPEGMSVSPSSAAGQGACSPAQIGLGTNDPPSCPQSSVLGTVEIETPLLEEPLEGDVILAKQGDNPFNSLLALYIAAKGPGFYLKLPGKVDLDPNTGQLTTTFDDNPQLPFSALHLELVGGPKAALVTPRSCGTYDAQVEFLSWASDTPVTQGIPMTFDQGCGTGGFDPGLRAGSANPLAGAFAAFNLQITRADGEQNLARIQATLPEGVLAKLAGVPLCGDAQAATGECPAASQVGTTTVGAGPGPAPIYVPEAGKAPTAVYLGGPYKGAPYSLVVKVPAQAGPFDLGNVVVRNALQVDTATAQVTAVSDPLPQLLQGIPVAYRDVRVEVNRPDFTINPTSCKPQQVTSVLTSATGQAATPSSPYQALGCGELGFGPRLKISLKGKMKRTGNPALKAVLKAPKGQANIAKTTVALPQAMFIDNAHISNPCTRVQFDAGSCPKGSILGRATAVTPLLDKPLSGPVYFRSNGGERELPDLVADLHGQIHVTLVGFIDSVKTGPETSRVRTRFLNVPDAPVSKFTIKLAGGKRGLIENSKNLCSFTPKAKVQMAGQNGKAVNSNLKLGTSCGGKKAKR